VKIADAIEKLGAAGIEDPARDARLLQRHAESEAAFDAMIARRAAREPASHILGRREFWSLDFAVTRACLDPRPDSETVVEAALSKLADRGRAWRILDLGTGSGCLLLALLSELPAATGLGVDKSPEALGIALGNAQRLGLGTRARFVERDWMRGLDGAFDVVVSNPPYIPTAEIESLQPEVTRYEPRLALDGGQDGLDAYRAIIPSLARLLAPGGFAALEVGAIQAMAVGQMARAAGFATECRADLAGRDRCLILTRP
jgi:release factor glutamine methyltransferase